MGITRTSRNKRSATGARRAYYRKKRAFEKGREPADTKIGVKRIRPIRTRGGNRKFRALRVSDGNFSFGSFGIAKQCRIVTVVFHPSNNELVRTNTLTRSAVVQIDSAPFRQYYEAKFGQQIGKKKVTKAGEETAEVKKSRAVQSRQAKDLEAYGKIDPAVAKQIEAGRLLAIISSRPGQSGRADGYVLEGEELAFYQRATRK